MTTVVAGVIERGQKILICQRNAHGAHPLKWEFPGGKVEPGEGLVAALKRELREELGIDAEVGREITRYEYVYPGKSPILLVFSAVTAFSGELDNLVFAQIAWAARTDLAAYDFLEGDTRFVRELVRQ
jgi:8-oxo-dGTP diphosphatase